ncbi:MAG: cobalt transporter CbiM [Lachnospiraceae bacterium]|jgi:cobalt/nickel transport system permease protein|nr:cobalt transporter CbiM [Lachnospiraceae bacterium]
MHIPENYLSPVTCGVMTVAMVPVWAHAIKKVKVELPKEKLPLVGVGAAFSFLAMMFNVPLVGGTTGHAVGGTLIALLFGPNAACLAVSVALLLQAVIFGDGGILAFGANCFNMAFILPYVGYAIYSMIVKRFGGANGEKTGVHYIAAAVGSYIGINVAAFAAAVEFGVQPLLFKDSLGNALYCPYDLSVSIPAMMIPHLAVAGFVEAIFTVVVFAFVRKTAPDLLFENIKTGAAEAKSHIPVFALIAVLVAATPLGLLATGTAWGEWGSDEIADVVTNGSALGYTPSGLENGWSLDVIMPDYAMEGMNEVVAYILSAIIGVALLVIIFKLASLLVKEKKVSNVA